MFDDNDDVPHDNDEVPKDFDDVGMKDSLEDHNIHIDSANRQIHLNMNDQEMEEKITKNIADHSIAFETG